MRWDDFSGFRDKRLAVRLNKGNVCKALQAGRPAAAIATERDGGDGGGGARDRHRRRHGLTLVLFSA